MGESRGRLRSALHRLSSTDQALEAEDLRETSDRLGGSPVTALPERQLACVCGTLKSVTLRPRAGVPALVAELYDGSGTINLVWLGRRQIPGIEPGRAVIACGRVTRDHEQPVIFNPRYELRPRPGE